MRFSVTSYFPSLHGKQAYYNLTPKIVKENIGHFFEKTAKNLYFHSAKTGQRKNYVKTNKYKIKKPSLTTRLLSVSEKLEIVIKSDLKVGSIRNICSICICADSPTFRDIHFIVLKCISCVCTQEVQVSIQCKGF